MPDIALYASSSNNGTVSPATPGSITSFADLIIVCIAAIGTNPTIATPTSFLPFNQIQKSQGATLAFAMYYQVAGPGGACNPSAVLGGTITGWVAAIFQFSQTGAIPGLQGSALQTSAIAQLTNIFPTSGQTLSNEVFFYAVARATATMQAQNSFMSPLSVWSASMQPQAGVQGLSMDFFFASGLGQGVGQYPQASGLLSGAVASAQIAAWFNTKSTQPGPNGDIIGGLAGSLVGGNYQGMLGG